MELPFAGVQWLVREVMKEAGDAAVLEPEDARDRRARGRPGAGRQRRARGSKSRRLDAATRGLAGNLGQIAAMLSQL